MKKIIVFLVIVLVLVGITLILNSNKTSFSTDPNVYRDSKTGISFRFDSDLFSVKKVNYDDLIIRLDPEAENLVGFQGSVEFLETKKATRFNYYDPFTGQFFFDPGQGKWRHIGPGGVEDDPSNFIIGKTIAGDTIYHFSSADAGGTWNDYIVSNRSNSLVIVLSSMTDEQPNFYPETEAVLAKHSEQKQELKKRFLEMAQSVIFP